MKSLRRLEVVKRGVKVLVIKAVCERIDVSEFSARVSCSETQCEGAYDKGSAQVPGCEQCEGT